MEIYITGIRWHAEFKKEVRLFTWRVWRMTCTGWRVGGRPPCCSWPPSPAAAPSAAQRRSAACGSAARARYLARVLTKYCSPAASRTCRRPWCSGSRTWRHRRPPLCCRPNCPCPEVMTFSAKMPANQIFYSTLDIVNTGNPEWPVPGRGGVRVTTERGGGDPELRAGAVWWCRYRGQTSTLDTADNNIGVIRTGGQSWRAWEGR